MDPHVALSTGQLVAVVIIPTFLLAGWLIIIFLADRDQARHSGPAFDGRPEPGEPEDTAAIRPPGHHGQPG